MKKINLFKKVATVSLAMVLAAALLPASPVSANDMIVGSCDTYGIARDFFAVGENVHVHGSGFIANQIYRIWIQPDPIKEGDKLNSLDDPSKNQEFVTTDSDGKIPRKKIWENTNMPSNPADLSKDWDIIIDKVDGGESTYNAKDDGIDDTSKIGIVAPVLLHLWLTPSDGQNPTGNSHTVTATATADGDPSRPLHLYPVTFRVSGANAGASGREVTDHNGQASWDYTGNNYGVDYISATAWVGLIPYESRDTVKKTWSWSPSVTAYDKTVKAQEVVEVEAKLIDLNTGRVISDKNIKFTPSFDTEMVRNDFTDFSGYACVSFPASHLPDGYTYLAEFAGDEYGESSSASATVTVTKRPTTLTAKGVKVKVEGKFQAKATLKDEQIENGISGKQVKFTFQGISKFSTTDGNGVASVKFVNVPNTADDYPLTADFAGDAKYEAKSDTATVNVVVECPENKDCCPPASTYAGTCYTPQSEEEGCCQEGTECFNGTMDPEECRECWGGPWIKGGHCEDDECIPEFTTIAIPIVTVLGLLFLISRRRQKR